ncbi:hypothetical protein OK074_3572 [Actinobacteria bacterium OK074]|nr:hypothetical protein OK074_3572 [Actinobacteria bacterium OK074]
MTSHAHHEKDEEHEKGEAGEGQRYVSRTGLRARGWTPGMVHRLLGAPDRVGVGARFRAAPRTRLYRLARVEAAERSDEFRALSDASARRAAAVRAALRHRREELLERIRTEPIEVPRLESGRLALRALEHRARTEAAQSRAASPPTANQPPPPDGSPPGPADRSSLDPWKVAYLLHRLRHHEQLLDNWPGHGRSSGRAEAAALLHHRIRTAIAEAYPSLAQECERQAHGQ